MMTPMGSLPAIKTDKCKPGSVEFQHSNTVDNLLVFYIKKTVNNRLPTIPPTTYLLFTFTLYTTAAPCNVFCNM